MLYYVSRLVNDFWFRQFLYDLSVSLPIVVSRRWLASLGNPMLCDTEKKKRFYIQSEPVRAFSPFLSIDGEAARSPTSHLIFHAISIWSLASTFRLSRTRDFGGCRGNYWHSLRKSMRGGNAKRQILILSFERERERATIRYHIGPILYLWR